MMTGDEIFYEDIFNKDFDNQIQYYDCEDETFDYALDDYNFMVTLMMTFFS